MKRKLYFVSRWFERGTTWAVVSSLLFSQLNLVAALAFLVTLLTPSRAEAARLGTSTVSAGSAPPPAATTVDSFQPDLFTGRASTGIPIAVPPGRKGVQPSFGLSYSSSSRNGWLGVGWSLDLGFIERSTRKGVPKYDTTDTFTFLLQSVSSELVKLPDGTYRAKDEGLFARFEDRGAAGWEIRDKSGTRYLFGQTATSRVANGTNVFRWHLEKVVDANGNTMTITYQTIDGQAYPSIIDYTGHETLASPPANRVNFILENRADIEESLRSGFALKISRRLAAIETYATVNGSLSLARRYQFTYRASERTGRSLLAGIQQIGSDGLTTLPPVTFAYQESNAPTYQITSRQTNTSQIAWNVRYVGRDLQHEVFPCNHGVMHPYAGLGYGNSVVVHAGETHSFNGGRVSVNASGGHSVSADRDMFVHVYTAVYCDSARTVSLGIPQSDLTLAVYVEDANGIRGGCMSSSYSLSSGWSIFHFTSDHQHQGFSYNAASELAGQVDVFSPSVLVEPQLAGDVDGNGITDIIEFNPASATWTPYCAQVCALSPGGTWLSGFGNNNSLPLLGDWNGDGRTDIGTFENGNWRFATSTGSSFLADTLPGVNIGNGSPLTGDFNGDGIMDLGVFNQGTWTLAPGNGTDFTSAGTFSFSLGDGNGLNQHLTGDFNGDGLTDIAFLSSDQLTIGSSDGRTFQTRPAVVVSGLPTNGVQSADFNGDGLSDLAFYDRSAGKVRVAYNTNAQFAALVDLSPTLTFSLRTERDQIQVADFNGDSLPDPAIFNATTGSSQLAYSEGGSPDLLVSISNGLGGGTAITYRPASSLSQNFLPFLTPLVTETRASDGLGNAYTNTYSYSEGLYDSATKEFRGFGRVEVRDAEGNVAVTRFHQDNARKGRPASAEFRDRLGRLFTQTTNLWDAVQPYPGTDSHFVRLTQTDSFTYDGDETFKHTRSRMQYDAYGNVTASFADGEVAVNGDERSAVTTYALNTTAWILNRPSLVQSLDANGNFVALRRFFYDNAPDSSLAPTKGNLTREEEWLDVDRDGPEERWIPTRMTYDGYGNVLRITDALNHSVTNTYDSATHTFLIQVANPLGHTRTMVYDPRFGYVTSSTDQNGVITTTEYDALGRIIKVIGPLDTAALPTTRYEYALSINPVRVTQYTRVQSGQAKELISHTFSDGLGRTIQVRSPAQSPAKQIVTGTVEFDSKGRVVRQWTPYLDDASTSYRPHTLPAIAPLLAPPVVHSYDPLGRLLATTDPDGSQTSITYDDWTVKTTDAKQQVKKRTSDALGRLVQVQEFLGTGTNATLYATTTYAYDSRDNLVLLTDAVGNTTTLQYDSLNRKISMTDPDMGTWTYAYDDVDKLAAQTDARSVSILFTYDALNRQTRKDYLIPPNINVPTNQPPVIYTYDNPLKQFSKGKLTEITDASGSSSFAYDTLGRLVTEQKTVDGTTYTIQRAYDLLGRLTTLTYPNNDVAAYTYNDQGGIQTITLQSPAQPVQPIINSVDYNAAGQITKMVYGNGVTTDYTYNPQTLRLDNLKSVGPGGVLQDFTYSFDPVGNVTAIADAVHTASQTFTYDSLNRLATANGARYGNFTYAYNQIGNMTGKEGVTQNYGALNNKPHAVTSTSSGLMLTYDTNGNLASKSGPNRPTQTFVFDAENRLIEVGSPTPHRKLDPGWNFVSFPQIVGEVPVTAALTNFAGNCEQLTRFNTRSNWFESFVNLPGTNQFDTVAATNGYALYVTNAAGMYLPLGDTPAPAGPRLLSAGTNFLAGPPDIMSATNWLAGLVPGVDYDQVLGLNANGSATTPVTTVRPGEAYYVRMLRPANWTPPTAARIANPSTVRFVYDGDGGRVKKITWKGATLFFGEGYEVSAESKTTTYVFAGGQRVAAKESTGSLRIYHSDHLGSANVITGQSGATVELTENTPYGSTSRLEGSINDPHKFTDQRLDDETGLYFYSARYYDPEIGRFVSADVFVQDLGDPQTLNRFAYAGNNPVLYIDPSGHFFWAPIIGAIIGAATAAATGGNILQGLATGAIGGLFGGVGSWIGGFGGAVIGGAAGGAVSAAAFGGNVGYGAFSGAIGGGIGYGVGQVKLPDNWVGDLGGFGLSAAGGALGGGISAEISGGDFATGARQGAIGGAIGYAITVDLPSAYKNAMSKTPRSHLFLDIIWDLANVGYDLYLGATGHGWHHLAFDAAAAAIPGMVAGGTKLVSTVAKNSSLFTRIPAAGKKFNQMAQRGWTRESIHSLVNNPRATSGAINKATGNPATAYFRADGHYVVRDNVTGQLVQMSDTRMPIGYGQGRWTPDETIKNPFIPKSK